MRLSEQSTGHLTTSAQKIQWVNCTTHIPEPLQGITLPTTLPTNLHCGLLTVPMDYSKSISSSNNITLGFAMRRPENPQGLLNFNPGGPNNEVASFAWAFALNDTSDQEDVFNGLDDFDFLAIDTRGSYQSNALNCPIGNLTFPSYIPSTEEEFKSYQGIASTYAQSCIASSTPPGIVEYVGSKQTVEDRNSVRAALGYEKMSLMGLSYGSYSGALYASKYPQHVERFVIDAIFPHSISNVDLATYQMSAVNRLLLRSDAYCLNDTSCPFHAQGKGVIPAAFAEVLSQAAAGNTSNITVTPSDVRAMVTLAYLSNNPNFLALNGALYLALNGNWTGLQWADAYGTEYMTGALPVFTTMCADIHIDNNTWEGFKAVKKAAFEVDSAKIEYSQGLSVIGLCGGWPYPGDSNVPIVQEVPMLIVTSDFDLNTPTEGATFEFKLAKTSTLVVRHGDDHGTVSVPGAGKDIEFEFLRTGVFPKAKNETYVTIYGPGSVRAPVPNPYDVPVGPAAGDLY
ncbi:alpha/beta-hydrolase [Athelia psychrophila]|uniref:Alpha/beta-hydrolase n=1 Tax=Athelia psychrophila TaxID=1759441 RepID=A0A166K6F3_9AGAM|nr:alpha/beta-hydrolase [Fibularhizoctonia sp. CBS 109695]